MGKWVTVLIIEWVCSHYSVKSPYQVGLHAYSCIWVTGEQGVLQPASPPVGTVS
jgi:hypothetical protein